MNMKYWILIHKFSSYIEHNDLIGLPARRERSTREILRNNQGELIPLYDYYDDLKIGDKIVYYCPAPKQVVIGLFEITEGPDKKNTFTTDWNESILFRIRPLYPVVEANSVPYNVLVQNLDFFKDEDGNPLEGRSASLKLWGTLKEIEENDFNKIIELYTQKTVPIEEEIKKDRDNLHIKMIKTTHIQANQFQCYSFIGQQERNRVSANLTEDNEVLLEFNELPSWISDIGIQLGTYSRLLHIDNLWFFQESPGFFIPFAAFEHEKDGNLRGVMDRFVALDNTLKSNIHLKDIKPLYFLVAKDDKQAGSYKRKITEHGEWNKFKDTNELYICSLESIETIKPKYVQTLTQHLIKIHATKL